MENIENSPANQNLLLKTFLGENNKDGGGDSDSQESMSAAQKMMAKFMLPPSKSPFPDEKPKTRIGAEYQAIIP